MRKNIRRAVALATGTVMAIGLCACGAETDSEQTTVTTEENSISIPVTEVMGQNFYGEITAVDETQMVLDGYSFTSDITEYIDQLTAESEESTTENSESTGAAGEMPSGEAPSGEAPSGEMPADTGTDGSLPEMPSGEAPSGEMPSGEDTSSESGAPSGMGSFGPSSMGGMGGMDTSSMELMSLISGLEIFTVTLDLNDETVLYDTDGNAADLASFEVGDWVLVSLDEDGNILSVTKSDIALSDYTDMSSFGNMGSFDMGSMGDAGGGMSGGMSGQMPGGQSSGVDSYTAVTEYTEDTTVEGESYTSTGSDENAILVSGGTVNLTDITVDRTSSDSTGGDNSSFYGVGAAILVTDGTVNVEGAEITTDSAGGAGVFAYGDGVAYVSDSVITTTQNTSGGVHVAGGGTLYSYNNTVVTNGESSAAIRSDRGGGTLIVDGGSYTSNGTGSPAVYTTADITISNATLTATNSEAVCIEGLNTLTLTNVDLSGNMPENSQNDCTWNVIVYQSMSGDSEVGNGTFNMIGGSLTAYNGGMFYTTNTQSTFYLSGVDITYADDNPFFLKVTGNSNARGWGSSGSNGSQCTFTADAQEMSGDVIWDSISTLDFYMMNGSSLTGAIVDDESNAGDGGDGYCNVYISSDSVWTVTGDSTVTALYNEGSIVDANGNTVSVIGTDGTVYVQGTSDVTITVTTYAESADFSGVVTP